MSEESADPEAALAVDPHDLAARVALVRRCIADERFPDGAALVRDGFDLHTSFPENRPLIEVGIEFMTAAGDHTMAEAMQHSLDVEDGTAERGR